MLLVQRFSFSLFSTYELEVILFEPLTLNPRSVNRYVLQRFCNRWALRDTGQYSSTSNFNINTTGQRHALHWQFARSIIRTKIPTQILRLSKNSDFRRYDDGIIAFSNIGSFLSMRKVGNNQRHPGMDQNFEGCTKRHQTSVAVVHLFRRKKEPNLLPRRIAMSIDLLTILGGLGMHVLEIRSSGKAGFARVSLLLVSARGFIADHRGLSFRIASSSFSAATKESLIDS